MEIALIIFAILCAVLGIIGSVVPGLPGPPVAWVGLLLLFLCPSVDVSATLLIVAATVALVITVLDYLVPSALTTRLGGSRPGIWGCNIGLVVSIFGLPFGPQCLLGVILWPFIGALVGELVSGKPLPVSIRSATGAFLGFVTGTLLKLFYCLALTIYVVVEVVSLMAHS
ncbi:MAG: DUF456 domain-containing protein [Bacteroidales bacterium]|nr:DUF456 domain-containing protein [Bacteroidales bacterium]